MTVAPSVEIVAVRVQVRAEDGTISEQWVSLQQLADQIEPATGHRVLAEEAAAKAAPQDTNVPSRES